MFYFQDEKQVTVYFSNGDIHAWEVSDTDFKTVISLCEKSNWVKLRFLQNQAKAIILGDVKIENDNLQIMDDNETINISLKDSDDKLIKFIKLLKDKGTIDTEIERIKPFLINMFENPYIDAVHEIYEYCKAMDFEITEDGCILAYKNVRDDLGSVYDNGKTKHIIGEYTTVDRFDTDRRVTCSFGLHFCSKSYLKSYSGQRTIIVKVNPKDIVSIPIDYNFAKGRCWRYMTVGFIAPNGKLATTNIEEATKEKVVKSETKKAIDKTVAKKVDRLTETIQNMKLYKNDYDKVAKVMGLSVSTVKRNINKYKVKHGSN